MSASTRGVLAVLASIILGTVLGAGPAAPATAASPGILVSLDGVHWMPGPVAGPLPGLGPLVPGGTAHWIVHIRNASPVPAVLRVSASVEASADFRSALSLSADSGSVQGPARLSASSECLELLSGIELADGEETIVTIAASVDVGAGDEVQGQIATAVVYATLVETPGVVAGPACPLSPSEPTTPPSAIARTGSDGLTMLPVVGGALVAVLLGGMLAVARRRSATHSVVEGAEGMLETPRRRPR